MAVLVGRVGETSWTYFSRHFLPAVTICDRCRYRVANGYQAGPMVSRFTPLRRYFFS